MSFHRHVPVGKLMNIYRDVYRWGKITNVHKITNLMQAYEKYNWRRVRLTEEKIYFRKWHYLKYAAEVVKYAHKHHLLFEPNESPDDPMRLNSIKPQQIPTVETVAEASNATSVSLNELRRRIFRIDNRRFMTNAEEAQQSSDADILTNLPNLEAPAFQLFLQTLQSNRLVDKNLFMDSYGQYFTLYELNLLYETLSQYMQLKLQKQYLEEKKQLLVQRTEANETNNEIAAFDQTALSRIFDKHRESCGNW